MLAQYAMASGHRRASRQEGSCGGQALLVDGLRAQLRLPSRDALPVRPLTPCPTAGARRRRRRRRSARGGGRRRRRASSGRGRRRRRRARRR
eukprot:4712967-Alexandrium_andersonii.AAC.1